MSQHTSHKPLMPWTTRAFTAVLGRLTGREDPEQWTAESVARQRAQVMPARRPVTWFTGAAPRGVSFSDTPVSMRDGEQIRVRIARPAAATADAPVIVYYHGGGWVLSNPDNYDPLTGFLADRLGAVVVAPDYRKAPQHKAPQASLDAFDVLRWVGSRPDQVGATGPIAVAGDSAGGNLSAIVAILARDQDGPALAGQALIYPCVDLTRSHPSSHWRDEAVLTGPSMDAFMSFYLDGAEVAADDPLISPLWAPSHADLPPALIQTAECDPLVDEGRHYAQVLTAAGVPTRLTEYAGMPHGFMSFPGATPVGAQARHELVDSLRGWFTL